MAALPKVNGSIWKRLANRFTKRKHRRRRNPGNRQVKRAADFYENFHWGERPEKVIVGADVSPEPDVLSNIGTLVNITYLTSKGGEKAEWTHDFGEEGGKRPKLAVDSENNRLHIVGGDYKVTERGIED